MAQIIDQIVKISIQEAIASVSTTSVNTVALVGRVGASEDVLNTAKNVASVEGAEVYGKDSELYAMVKAFFAQDSQPNNVVCIPLAKDGAFGTALNAIKTASADFDFYHIVIATNDGSVASGDLTSLQEWLADSKKVAHIQTYNGADLTTAITNVKGLAEGLDSKNEDRIALYFHKETNGDNLEFLPVGIVALRCSLDSARGTFAHKKCSGVTNDSYSTEQYNTLVNAGVNIYVKVSGEARLFMGSTCNSETFIDQIVKDDWVRFNVQSRIYQLLGEANDGHGVNYDDAGIAAVAASVLNVLALGQDTDHQYIMADSASVDYKSYDYLSKNYAEDVRKRNLPLIKGKYSRMNSIHTVVQVELQVTL